MSADGYESPRRFRIADISEVIEEAVQQYLDEWERQRSARGLPPLTVE